MNDQGDIVYMMSPSVMYLPKDIKNYKQYYQLLAENTQRLQKYYQTEGIDPDDHFDAHLKITIGHYNEKTGAYPIVKVEKPTPEEWKLLIEQRETFREGGAQKTAKVGLRTAMTKGAAQAFFRLFKSISCDRYSGTPCLTFQYAPDGCQARAHYMRQLLEGNGYACEKIFAFANTGMLQAHTQIGCCVQWGWHVAPLVKVRDGSSITPMVIDPSIFNKPVTVSEWLNAMESGCVNGGVPSIYSEIRPATDYSPRYGAAGYIQDDDYSKTNKVLYNYRNKSGCVEYKMIN